MSSVFIQIIAHLEATMLSEPHYQQRIKPKRSFKTKFDPRLKISRTIPTTTALMLQIFVIKQLARLGTELSLLLT